MSVKRKKRVLAIDDEPAMTEWLTILLEHSDYEVKTALIGTRGEELFRTWKPDAVVTDMLLPDIDGIDLVRRFKEKEPDVEVIMITGQGNIPRSVEAVKAGAYDFLEKPVDADLLLDKLEKAIKHRTLADENEELRQRLQDRYRFRNVVGKSRKMEELFELIESVAASEANILIQGENGTGKELIANAIHFNSKRAKGPFIKINCAAIPKDLIESELFGYKKGAFTGAMADKEGLLEMAEGGSLLLDEIGEMPAYLQTKLLRVLQEREYRPIGSDRIVHVDFRLICATNVDLEAALRDGRLREDLYFRINTIGLRVPPLRERTEDIPLLCDYFLDKFRRRYEKSVKTLAPAVYHILIRSRWPGNVRELENAIERAVLVAKGSEITVGDLPESIREESTSGADFVIPPHRTLAEIEKMAILQTLQRTNWNKQEAAQILGLYRPTLYSKMKKHDIQDGGKSARMAAASASAAADEEPEADEEEPEPAETA
ncbi:MAG: sigma-54-dependent transcriptional regulator [Vicinamibacterales bacterium]